MFFRHLHDCDRQAHGESSRSRAFGRHMHGDRFGRREGRMFDGGELRLAILALVEQKPRYGYEIIKALGERVGGDYSPSPGVVYPTLTMIEEMGYASASQDAAGRKLYTITPEGAAYLATNKAQVDAIFARLDGGNENRYADGASVLRAMLNLRAVVRLRVRDRAVTAEQLRAIADALDAAAKTIDKI